MLKTADLIRNFLLPTVDLTKNTYRYHKIHLEFLPLYTVSTPVYPSKYEKYLPYISLSPYRAVKTLHFGYKQQSFNVL
jgi:hypothetical protein